MKNHLHKRTAMAMLCASAALLLQACGGGGGDGNGSFEPAAGAPASTTAAPPPAETASVNAFKALDDLGSSQNTKNLLTAIATGGVLGGLNLNPTGLPTVGGGAEGFMRQLGTNLTAGVARTVISNGINGGSLEDGLRDGLLNAFLDTVAAQGANFVGTNFQGLANKVAHLIVGCAVGAARPDGSCAAGALGSTVGEAAAEAYGRRPDTVQFANMLASFAVGAAGGDANEIAQGGAAGANAAANNYLSHDELAERAKQSAACDTGDSVACAAVKALDNLSAARNAAERDRLSQADEQQNLERMADLTRTMQGLVDYKHGLERQLDATSDPQRRSELQGQINLADNNVRQVASLGKDTLLTLYQ